MEIRGEITMALHSHRYTLLEKMGGGFCLCGLTSFITHACETLTIKKIRRAGQPAVSRSDL